MTPTFAFRPKPIVTMAAILFVSLTLWLSSWQFGRAEQKRSLEELYHSSLALEPADLSAVDFSQGPERLRYLRVAARGSYAPVPSLLVDNRMSGPVPGYWVLSPLVQAQDGAPAILVARGWTPASADRSNVPEPPAVPGGSARVVGTLVPDSSGVLELSDDTVSGRVWQNAKIGPMGRELGLELLPMLLVADEAPPGLDPIRIKPDFKVLNSVSYAWQWLSFALLATCLYVGLNLKRVR